MGTGHVMRCLTLADELKQNYAAHISFISRDHQGHLADYIRSRGYELNLLPSSDQNFHPTHKDVPHAAWLKVPWTLDAKQTIKAITKLQPDWLIVDHYSLDARWHSLLRPYVAHILAIDDLADRKLDCDILLDQTYGREKKDYTNLVKKNCNMLLGSGFALLRPEYTELRPQAVKKRKYFDNINSILVTMGGTDPNNLTSIILDSLVQIDWSIDPYIEVVMGRQSPHLEVIKKKIKHYPFKISISIDVSDMAVRILKADLAIGAGGATSWERCCLGLPSVMITTAENQRNVGIQLSKSGIVQLIGNGSSINQDEIKKAIEQLIRSKSLWHKMSSRCLMITDGLGAKRVTLELDLPKSREGLPIYLRTISMNDSKLLYKWQCNPATRQYAHNPKIPTLNEHNKWLERKIQCATSFNELIFHGNEPAGSIRLDLVENAINLTYIVSIYISPDKYKLGIAKVALDIITFFLPTAELRAEVHKDNLASHALFKSARFYKCNEELYVKSPDSKV